MNNRLGDSLSNHKLNENLTNIKGFIAEAKRDIEMLRKRPIRNLAFFYRLVGVHYDKDDYKHRLMLQKIVYLLDSMNRTEEIMRYNDFSWFIRGPYSPTLTTEMHNVGVKA